MGHAGLSGYAIAGMLLFIAVFATLMLRLWLQARLGRLDRAGAIPLDDGRLAGGTAPAAKEAPSSGIHEEST